MGTYLVPNADISFAPLVSRVHVRTLGEVVIEEVEEVVVLLMTQSLEGNHAFWVEVQ